MRRFVLPSAACLAPPYFSMLPHNQQVLEKIVEHKMSVLIFPTILSQTSLILRRIQRDIIINEHRSLCKVPLFFSDFNED
jgi:hypothetical protein